METISRPVASPEFSSLQQAKRNAMEELSAQLQVLSFENSPSVEQATLDYLNEFLLEVRGEGYKKDEPREKWAMESAILKLQECLELEVRLKKEEKELELRQEEIRQLFPGLKWLLKAASKFGRDPSVNDERFLVGEAANDERFQNKKAA